MSMINAAYWKSQKETLKEEIKYFLQYDLDIHIHVPNVDVCEYIDEIYDPVVIAGLTYPTGSALLELDEITFKEFKDMYEADICIKITDYVTAILEDEYGESHNPHMPYKLEELIRQYIKVCNQLHRCDN